MSQEATLNKNKGRHAYLILAHTEFELLRLLIKSLDDPRNDIFVHLDAKVEQLPELETKQSRLYFLSERYDVFWGDVSVLRAEFALFREAYTQSLSYGGYMYYHLLSGVDLPLKSQDYIHNFFAQHEGKEFIGFYRGAERERDICRKVQRFHLFPRSFRPDGQLNTLLKRIIRAVCIRLQEWFAYQRHTEIHFDKGTQWLSITQALTAELLRHEGAIVSLYDNSFCSDEIAIHTYVANSPFMSRVFDLCDEGLSCMRHIGWEQGKLRDFEAKDFAILAHSPALFARKFNSRDMAFIYKVLSLSAKSTQEDSL